MDKYMNNNFSVHSNSKGNLLKGSYRDHNGITHFVKTGRLQVRDFPGKWSIEPVIEVICHELGKVLGAETAEQELRIARGERLGSEFITLVCDSSDFRNGESLIYLQGLYVQNKDNIQFEKLCRNTGCKKSLMDMLAFDLIIMNEDRHNSNVGWLMNDEGRMKLSPIYDNGYSLLYDDIKGMLKDYYRASRYCLCNAPLYQENFKCAERIFAENLDNDLSVNLNADRSMIDCAIKRVKQEYVSLISDTPVNNIELPDIWWERIVDFVMWRIEYVRNLRNNMAEQHDHRLS